MAGQCSVAFLVAVCLALTSCAAVSTSDAPGAEADTTPDTTIDAQVVCTSADITRETPPSVSDEGPPSESAKAIVFPEKLSLVDAMRMALEANKDIIVASLDADASRERIGIPEGEFDPRLFAEYSRGESDTPLAEVPLGRSETADGTFSTGLRQRIPTGTTVEVTALSDYTRDIPGKPEFDPVYATAVGVFVAQDILKDAGWNINRTDVVIARNNSAISAEALRNALISNLFEVERVYWRLYFAQADLTVAEQRLERAEKLVEKAQAQEAVGISAPLEVIRARSSAAGQAALIPQFRNRVVKLRHQMLRLLGVIEPELVGVEFELVDAPPTDPVRTSLDQAIEIAKRFRPDYRQARLAVTNAALVRSFTANQVLPTLQLVAGWAFSGLGEDLDSSIERLDEFDSWQVGVVFETPLPNRTAHAEHKAARVDYRSAEAQLAGIREQITREVADAIDDLHTQRERMAAARQARELAERVLQAEEKSFSLGRSDSLDVLAAQGALASAERDEVLAQTDYAIAAANLLRVEGILLEQKGITFVEDR